jgi:glutamine amidotransferase
MCRILAYLGEPLPVQHLLFDTDNSLVRQSYSPRMMNTFLNLAGFGMKAWDPTSLRPDDPFTYRATSLPSFDRNLRAISSKLASTCLVAHVRGVTYSGEAVVADTNLHPFHFVGARVVLAHNGHLRQFRRMRYSLVEHVRPELAQRIEGTTDSEWIYALILSQLDDPYGVPEARELADATASALRILRDVRAAHGIDTSSPVNLCVSTGRTVVATRVSFDYGWYPPEDEMLETDLPFVSLWYALGGEYTERDGDWQMTAGDPPRSVIIASEPLTADFSTWLEVPEYSMLTAELTPEGVEFETRDLDV